MNEFDKKAEQIISCVLIPEETDLLTKLASKAKHGIVELGALTGRSSVYLGTIAKKNKVPMLCVDIWEDDEVYE